MGKSKKPVKDPKNVVAHPYYPVMVGSGMFCKDKVVTFKSLSERGKMGVLGALEGFVNTGYKNMMSQGRVAEKRSESVLQTAFENANPGVEEWLDEVTLDALKHGLDMRFMLESPMEEFKRRMEDLRETQARKVGNATRTDTKWTVKKPQSGGFGGDPSSFSTMTVSDLELYRTNNGRKLTGKLVSTPGCVVGINTMLQDANGDTVELGLYNQTEDTSYETIDKIFYPGRSVTIVEPYLKIFNSGLIGVRVDSPAEVIFNDELQSDLQKGKLEVRGDVANKNYRTAITKYESTLKTCKEIELIVTLLSNRAQAHLKVSDYREAMLDAAAALQFDKHHKKSRQRYNTAFGEMEVEFLDYNAGHTELPLDGVLNMHPDDQDLELLAAPSTSDISTHKATGNTFYGAAQYDEAIEEYSKALNHPDALEAAYILSDLSTCYLKVGLYESALCASAAVLRFFATTASTADESWHRIVMSCIHLRRYTAAGLAASYIEDADLSKTAKATLVHTRSWSQHGPMKSSLVTHSKDDRMTVSLPKSVVPEHGVPQWVHPALRVRLLPGDKGRGVVAGKNLDPAIPILVDVPLVTVEGGGVAAERQKAGSTLIFLNTKDQYTSEMLNNLTPGEVAGGLPKGVKQFPELLRKPQSWEPLVIGNWEADRTCETMLDDILQRNSFGANGKMFLFPIMSMLNHSSEPNATIMQLKAPSCDLDAVILFPTKEILAGTEVTIEYSSNPAALENVWGIPQ